MSDINIGFETIKILISSGIATVAAFKLSNWTNQIQEEKRYKEELSKIIQISIQYPELEDEVFIAKFPGDGSNRSDFLHYESYCILIFNLLEQVSVFYKFKTYRIEKFVFIKEWVNIHRKWWQAKTDNNFNNQLGYSEQFIRTINSYLKA